MKKTILFFLALASTFAMKAQTTFDLDWEQGINGASASFTIAVGDAVRWTWSNGVPHSVTNKAGSAETFDSGILTGAGTQFTYTFTVVGSNDYDCVVHPASMFGTITVEEVLSVQDKFEKNIQVYPNPMKEEVTIASLYQFESYEIYDLNGKRVSEGIGEGTYTQMNVSHLPSGVYFMRVKADDLEATVRLVKQ